VICILETLCKPIRYAEPHDSSDQYDPDPLHDVVARLADLCIHFLTCLSVVDFGWDSNGDVPLFNAEEPAVQGVVEV
jgi:hypothetical protein